ncbi:O-antigen ligase family protein [Neptuniibacter sp. CAU 1671]|uniref:O-antigen ligase family protein n=1 Tax=Neptuniibacter sp. CAU 1671 TaxID=3032593 RepID=UPI0023D9F47F|nr:O-antigen ligase family protein [Neptuniibacter sp. CAU 1671]MDF2181410.1 O-antigen ligase family protein [Neptuniibacter sp. CAU 1671]
MTLKFESPESRFFCAPYDHFLLAYVFIFLPFADMVTGWLVLSSSLTEGGFGSPSQIFRAILLPLLFFRLAVGVRPVWAILPIFLLFIETVHVFFHQSLLAYSYGIIFFSRIIYLCMLYAFLVELYKSRMAGIIFKYMACSVILIALSLVFAFITDTGFSTYGWGFGTKGYFASGNGLGLNLGVSTLLLLYIFHAGLNNGLYVRVGIFFGLLAIFLIGSKTAWLLGGIVIISYFCFRYFGFMLFVLFPIVFGFLILFGGKLNRFFDVIVSRYNSSPDFLTFITSGRNDYFYDAWLVYMGSSPGFLNFLFGKGFYCSFRVCDSVVFFDTLESDLADIFFMYGLIGVCLYFSFFIYFVFLFFMRKKYFLCFVWLLVFGHSAVAGHVMQNGMNLTLMAVFVALAYFILTSFSDETIK